MEDKVVGSNGKINLVPGFETYLGNYRVMHRMMKEMGVGYSLLCDPTEVLDTPADGEFRMYDGGTRMAEVKDAPTPSTPSCCSPGSCRRPRSSSR
jgi:nitrogenase molybdenum-iron protein beta chain